MFLHAACVISEMLHVLTTLEASNKQTTLFVGISFIRDSKSETFAWSRGDSQLFPGNATKKYRGALPARRQQTVRRQQRDQQVRRQHTDSKTTAARPKSTAELSQQDDYHTNSSNNSCSTNSSNNIYIYIYIYTYSINSSNKNHSITTIDRIAMIATISRIY